MAKMVELKEFTETNLTAKQEDKLMGNNLEKWVFIDNLKYELEKLVEGNEIEKANKLEEVIKKMEEKSVEEIEDEIEKVVEVSNKEIALKEKREIAKFKKTLSKEAKVAFEKERRRELKRLSRTTRRSQYREGMYFRVADQAFHKIEDLVMTEELTKTKLFDELEIVVEVVLEVLKEDEGYNYNSDDIEKVMAKLNLGI